ncbi:MAG: RIP metalloprotease RseP [Cyanobacteria bacterium HKST-UBA02]|nr:RIP metalloprotease RseP [Cyanobacteria bacterium HKST-UBA02]
MFSQLATVMAGNPIGIAAMIFGFAFLILIHELGHWLVARAFGFKTPVFSIGFGKREWSWVLGTWWETEFRISPILLGGYVKIPELTDESALGKDKAELEAPARQFPVWQKIAVALAGVTMNMLLAFVMIASLFAFIGRPTAGDIQFTAIGELSPQVTIARDAGLQTGDRIVSIDGVSVTTPQDAINVIKSHPGQEVVFVVDRSGKQSEIHVTPGPDGRIGIALNPQVNIVYEKQPLGTAIVDGIKTTGTQTVAMVKGIGMMVGLVEKPQGLPEGATDVHGVVGIVQIGAQMFEQGMFAFIWLLAMLNINLAIMNVLPLPLLDGGHVVFFAVEGIMGKPVSPVFKERLYRLTFALLMALMFYALFNDIFNPVKLP